MKRRASRHRGMVSVWVVLVGFAMVGLVGLGCDWAYLAHAEEQLQIAADAGALAGAEIVEVDPIGAVTAAVNTANANKVLGHAVQVTAADVIIGRYTRATGGGTFVAGATPYNAVQVTARRTTGSPGGPLTLAFAVPGLSTADRLRSATAMAQENPAGGIIGFSGIDFKNNFYFGTYNSATDPAGNSPFLNSLGWVGTNGTIGGKNNDTVDGSVRLGPSGSAGKIKVNGTTTVLPTNLTTPIMPAWSPPGVVGTYSVPDNSSAVLPGGTYWWTNLNVGKNATLSFSGPATLYVNGNVTIGGTLAAYNSLPVNLRIYQYGANQLYSLTVAGSNHIDITADYWAPGVAMDAKNNFTFRGRALFGTFTTEFNNSEFLYDINLKYAGHVFLVQ